MRPQIYLGADHAGFHLKQHLVKFLREHGYEVEDVGAHQLELEDDYPVFAKMVAERVARTQSRGIVLCGNAEGVCIVANKVRGVRGAVGYSVYAATTTRTDDDANILCLPGRVLTRAEAERIVMKFLTTPFSGATRHVRRLKQVKKIDYDRNSASNSR